LAGAASCGGTHRRIGGHRSIENLSAMTAAAKGKRIRLDQIRVLMLVDPGPTGTSEPYVERSLKRFTKGVVVHAYAGLEDLLDTIKKTGTDLVFNYTEVADGDRSKDGHICAALDLCGIAYTGAGPRGLMLCRDKAISKLIAARQGFRSPAFFVLQAPAPRLPAGIEFPLVVKPRYGDASEGISQASLVRSRDALMERVAVLRRAKCNDIICEEFIGGREMIVAFIGRQMVPPKEFFVGRQAPGAPVLACGKFKHDAAYRRRWSVHSDPATLTASERRTLKKLLLDTAEALDMRDYGRLDVKLTASGEWAFLEANPNPGLTPFGKSFAGTWGGVNYDRVVTEIVQRALERAARA
jgi:D-alanine-D-alanine ligase